MFRSNQSNKSQEIIIIHFLLIGAIVLRNGLLYSNTVFQKTTFEANQSGLNYHSKNFRRGGDESERIFIFLEWQLSSWWWGEKVVGFFFGFLRLAEPPAFQITLEALDVRNSFQNDVQFADVFLTFDGWNEFLQSSVRIDFGVFLSHVSVLFHHSPGCFLVVGGWQHWCHLHTHDFWWIFVKDYFDFGKNFCYGLICSGSLSRMTRSSSKCQAQQKPVRALASKNTGALIQKGTNHKRLLFWI